MLGRDEIHSILEEQGSVSVDCEFCGNRYEFDHIDAEQLFTALHSIPTTSTRH